MTQSNTNTNTNTNTDTLKQGAAEREKADLEIAEVGNATENLKEAEERLKLGEDPESNSEKSDYLEETREAEAKLGAPKTQEVGNSGENAEEAAIRLAEGETGNK